MTSKGRRQSSHKLHKAEAAVNTHSGHSGQPAAAAASNQQAASSTWHGIDYFNSTNNKMLPLHTVQYSDLEKFEMPDRARAVLAELHTKNANAKEQLRLRIEKQFPSWLFELREGFSVLLYGFGSKRALLDKFARQVPDTYGVLAVNCLARGLTANQILMQVAQALHLCSKSTLRHHDEQLLSMMRSSSSQHRLIVVLHTIEGIREQSQQAVLSDMAALPMIHVIASMDHVGTPLLWDKAAAARFNWLWHNVTNYEPYTVEAPLADGLLNGRSETHMTCAAASKVLESLVSNALKVYRLLLERIIEEGDSLAGLLFDRLYQDCRDRFLVQNQQALRAHLTEFRDHSLVEFRRAADGAEVIGVAYDFDMVLQLYEQIEQQLQ